VIILAILSEKTKIEIKSVEINNQISKQIRYKYELILKIYIFFSIKIFQKKIIEESNIKQIIRKLKKENNKMEKMHITPKLQFKFIKNLKLKISDIVLNVSLGTFSIEITNLLILGISTIIPIFINNYKAKNIKYKIIPNYNKGNLLDLKFEGIIEIKFLHILYALYLLKRNKKRKKEKIYVRVKSKSSNRRINGNCNE
jgi:hypothetical protein